MKQYDIEKMENCEINAIKDDLVFMESLVEGTPEAETIAKTVSYINYLEEKLVDVANDKNRAMRLLVENDYAVIKKSKCMIEDEEECSKMMDEGEDKDCLSCSCSICICS